MQTIKMLVAFVLLMLSLQSMAGALPAQSLKTGSSNDETSLNFKMKPFTTVKIHGNAQVDIIGGTNKHDVRLIGRRQALHQLEASVQDGVLTIQQSEDVPTTSPVLVVIRMRTLSHLQYQGNGRLQATGIQGNNVTMDIDTNTLVDIKGHFDLQQLTSRGNGAVRIQGLSSDALNIVQEGAGNVSLSGVAKLNRLDYDGQGSVSLYWVDSAKLLIHGRGTGLIRLGGVAKQTQAILAGAVHLDARYLRSQHMYIDTKDSSRADIWVDKSINTIAKGTSNIYYYHEPDFQTAYMADMGAVLKMGELP